MIFVTVGTHEQQFDRLIRKIDELKGKGKIKQDVFMQIGYSTYLPQYCKYERLIGFEKMNELSHRADIIITHGGPGSMLLPWSLEKKPIVVPRNPKFKEHIDNHQILFSRKINLQGKIILCEDVEELENLLIDEIDIKIDEKHSSNTESFCTRLDNLLRGLF